MNYFGYGSNMCLPRLLDRVKSAQFLETAKIEGRRLEFFKRSDGRSGASGKATLVLNEGSIVYGGLFYFDEKDIEGLRKAEGYPNHYGEEMVQVTALSGVKEVMTYIGKQEYYDESQVPFDWYVELIRFGGRHLGIPEDYMSRFDSCKTKIDPITTRSMRERAFLK